MSFICHIHNYTEYNEEWNVFSAFNPSKCTHLEQWAADCAAPGEQSWTSCRSRDSNPQAWDLKSNALSIGPRLHYCHNIPFCFQRVVHLYCKLEGTLLLRLKVIIVLCTNTIFIIMLYLYIFLNYNEKKRNYMSKNIMNVIFTNCPSLVYIFLLVSEVMWQCFVESCRPSTVETLTESDFMWQHYTFSKL